MSFKSTSTEKQGETAIKTKGYSNENVRPNQQSSERLRSLNIHNQYLKLVASGQVTAVEQHFQKHSTLNKNYENRRNQNALQIAIENKHQEMCEFLLQHKVVVFDNLFHAINKNFYKGVELILQDGKRVDEYRSPEKHPESFCIGMTPVILAAQNNNYEILELLAGKDFPLLEEKHHDKSPMDGEKTVVETAAERILVAQARASPAYISLFSQKENKDSMDFCIDLIKEFKKRANIEHELLQFYTELQEKVEKFMCSVLDKVHRSAELAMLFQYEDELVKKNLKKNQSTHREECDGNYTCKMDLLQKACKNKLVDFVTHRVSQLAIAAQRYPYVDCMQQSTIAGKYCVEGLLGLLYPIFSLFYICYPDSILGGAIVHPSIFLASHLVSDFIFILLLIVNALLRTPETDFLGAPPTAVEWLIYVWVVGKLEKEIVELCHRGWKNYLTDWWNYNDLIQILLFIGVMICRILDYKLHGDREDRVTRGSWGAFEPRTISTGLLAFAYVFVFLQILNLMRTSKIFGPLQLSLAKMLINIVQFLCIFSLILFAFALAFTELYSYYGTPEGSLKLCKFLENGTVSKCNKNTFYNMGDSLLSLFWSLFGIIDVEKLSLSGKQPFIETVGFILLGVYHVAAITVLVNMLIAMMARSFDVTSENRDKEWKFYRTVVWIQFIRRETTIPPPMNLIPNPWEIGRYVKSLISKLKNENHTEVGEQFTNNIYQGDAGKKNSIASFVTNDSGRSSTIFPYLDESNDEAVPEDSATIRVEMITETDGKQNSQQDVSPPQKQNVSKKEDAPSLSKNAATSKEAAPACKKVQNCKEMGSQLVQRYICSELLTSTSSGYS